jgi:transcriptional regulator with XRE-family HTH domain
VGGHGEGPDRAEASGSRPSTLAAKLDYLFRQVHPRARGEFSYREVAAGVESAGGPTISPTYIMYLRKGERTNPTMQHLEALAKFFGVPTAYFLDDDTTVRTVEELDVVAAMRDEDVRTLALHVSELSPEGRAAVARMVEELRRQEQQPVDKDDPSA